MYVTKCKTPEQTLYEKKSRRRWPEKESEILHEGATYADSILLQCATLLTRHQALGQECAMADAAKQREPEEGIKAGRAVDFEAMREEAQERFGT